MYLHAAPYVYILCFISYILLRKCFISDGCLAGGAKRLLMGPAWVATSGARRDFFEKKKKFGKKSSGKKSPEKKKKKVQKKNRKKVEKCIEEILGLTGTRTLDLEH